MTTLTEDERTYLDGQIRTALDEYFDAVDHEAPYVQLKYHRMTLNQLCIPEVVRDLIHRLDAANKEGLEQARIIGMGAERELRLQAELEEARKALAEARVDALADVWKQVTEDRHG